MQRKTNLQEFYPDRCEDENGKPCCPSDETILGDIYNSGIYDMEWNDLLETLQEVLDKKNPDSYWKARVENFGWRNSSGQTSFRLFTAKEILQKILPDCDCTFYVYEDGPGLKIRNFHHNSPTGNEWYYLQPDEDYTNYCDNCDNEWETEGLYDSCPKYGAGFDEREYTGKDYLVLRPYTYTISARSAAVRSSKSSP